MSTPTNGAPAPPTLSEIVTRNVRAELARAALGADEVAAALGVSRDSAYRRIRGAKSWGLDELDAIAKIAEIPRSALLREP